MEGFLNLKWSRFRRVVLTRSLAIVPTFVIAFYSNIESLTHMNDILNILQSILLPFALIPGENNLFFGIYAVHSTGSIVSRRLFSFCFSVLHFCALPSVMGSFHTGRFWIIAGPVVSLGIIGINLYFAYDIVSGFDSVTAYAIAAVVSIIYFVTVLNYFG